MAVAPGDFKMADLCVPSEAKEQPPRYWCMHRRGPTHPSQVLVDVVWYGWLHVQTHPFVLEPKMGKWRSPTQAEDGRCRSQKKPRRILHFSDGIMEEYSTDEEEEEEEKKRLNPNQMRVVDPKTMKWGPWLYYWMAYSGSSALSFCDYVGESLANTLGITSPKYQYELDEYNATLEEEKAEKEREKAEMAGWTTTAAAEPGDGIRHKIVDTSVLQEPTLPQPLDQYSMSQAGWRRASETSIYTNYTVLSRAL
ncbi:hypothetical protein O3P69_010670 [Scylla paramamosain]|uniref:Protein FAM177A1 n=1 Tax=Scylla paramamosain TaxID=85552 RepID=A0AAW0TF54_SCYPA